MPGWRPQMEGTGWSIPTHSLTRLSEYLSRARRQHHWRTEFLLKKTDWCFCLKRREERNLWSLWCGRKTRWGVGWKTLVLYSCSSIYWEENLPLLLVLCSAVWAQLGEMSWAGKIRDRPHQAEAVMGDLFPFLFFFTFPFLPLSLFSFALPFPPSWTLVAHSIPTSIHLFVSIPFFIRFNISLHTIPHMSSSILARQTNPKGRVTKHACQHLYLIRSDQWMNDKYKCRSRSRWNWCIGIANN